MTTFKLTFATKIFLSNNNMFVSRTRKPNKLKIFNGEGRGRRDESESEKHSENRSKTIKDCELDQQGKQDMN
eukprot:scaffold127356_cov83-Cyclotella_meneghiniana.AAC.2